MTDAALSVPTEAALPAFRSAFLSTLAARGYLHQCSDPAALDGLLADGTGLPAYIGFDCTGPSLHVGHLMGIMMLRRFQQAGHKPIVLMGGGTTKVGDPSGKDEQRKLLTDADIEANKASIKTAFDRFLSFGDGPTDAIMVDNAEWLDQLAYIPFLRDVGRHFSVNRMLTFDSVRMRLEREQPLSFLEFNYMILQAYDFVELGRRYGCRLQMGGSDQWGNIVNGIDLGRRVADFELFAVTCPLITTASGAKMGKTAAGAVWLNADMLSPWDYWQFWRNTADADVERFLKLFTDLPLDEIARLAALPGQEINEAKKVLATEATAMLHGREAAGDAQAKAEQTFKHREFTATAPTVYADDPSFPIIQLLVANGIARSTSEARRNMANNAYSVGGIRLTDPNVTLGDLPNDDDGWKVSVGKKMHFVIKIRD